MISMGHGLMDLSESSALGSLISRIVTLYLLLYIVSVCSIDIKNGMMTANLSVIPSGVYEFKCKVIDNYIPDTTCAYNCNNQGGTAAQIENCKSTNCRVKAEAISTVKAVIKTIDEAPVWSGASIRLKGGLLDA